MPEIRKDALNRVTDRDRSGWSDLLLRQLYTKLQLEMPTNITLTATNQITPKSINVDPKLQVIDQEKLKAEREKAKQKK